MTMEVHPPTGISRVVFVFIKSLVPMRNMEVDPVSWMLAVFIVVTIVTTAH